VYWNGSLSAKSNASTSSRNILLGKKFFWYSLLRLIDSFLRIKKASRKMNVMVDTTATTIPAIAPGLSVLESLPRPEVLRYVGIAVTTVVGVPSMVKTVVIVVRLDVFGSLVGMITG
jgi:hypothetical protein